MNVKISPGNSKLGLIPSVSLSSIVTCRECECRKKCYAKKIERLRPKVRESYENNLRILNIDPETYWREVEATIMMSRLFRFHVSGDIVDKTYFGQMVSVSDRNRHCEVICFTKKYEIVNAYLDAAGGWLPGNIHIIFSAWPGLEMVNPFALPEAHVRFRDGFTTARNDAIECSGNCSVCAVSESNGCWGLKPGDQIVINEH